MTKLNGSGTEHTLARVDEAATAMMAERVNGIEPGSQGATMLKHMETIFEHAVHSQIEPMRELIAETESMISVQLQQMAKLKSESQLLMLNGERACALVSALRAELNEMRSRHAELITARTS